MSDDGGLGQRFWSKVEKTETCWNWTAYVGVNGYGRYTVAGHPRLAHRVSYEAATCSAIPPGMEIDHLCRNRRCVRPGHLEPVTPRENTRRSDSPWGINARKDECKNGHAFTPENTYLRPTGGRGCKECRRAAARKWSPKRVYA